MPTYKRCREESVEVDSIIEELISQGPDHVELSEAKVTINALFAYPKMDKYGRPMECAIKVNRYPAHACIKVTSYKDRVKGMADAELIIDFTHWENCSTLEKAALLDHELTHLQIVTDDYDRPQKDSAGRPKLSMRLHDVQFGWFSSVAKRWGHSSAEIKQAAILFDKHGQSYWPELWEVTKRIREALNPQPVEPAPAAAAEPAAAAAPPVEDPVPGVVES